MLCAVSFSKNRYSSVCRWQVEMEMSNFLPSEYLSDVRERISLAWWVLMWEMSSPAVTLVHGSELVYFFYVTPLSLFWFLAKKYLRKVNWIKSLARLLISNEESWYKFCSACAFNPTKQTWKHIPALCWAHRLQCGPGAGMESSNLNCGCLLSTHPCWLRCLMKVLV